MSEDDDDYEFDALYANGHWIWDDNKQQLKFISDIVSESAGATTFIPAAIVGPVEFKDELDVVEQQRFRKRIQRKPKGPDDVIMLQDVKDLVLYCAPISLLSATVINVLHTATTERFLRALILYCQYYLQTVEIMDRRTLELHNKIPTSNSKTIESRYQENLNDLRLLVAKEYCTMLLGADDFRKYHHMGKDKKLKSLSRKEAMIFEPLIRLSVQIVWIALARRHRTTLDLEINRLFRSKKFNLVEHNLKLNMDSAITPGQRQVLRGECFNPNPIHIHSPFFNEVECIRDVDFKMLGLGIIKYHQLDDRLRYLENLITMPESKFPKYMLNLGIIGLKRKNYDPMLREIQLPVEEEGKPGSTGPSGTMKSLSKRASKVSNQSKKSTHSDGQSKYFPIVYLPEKTTESESVEFIAENNTRLAINTAQNKKWLALIAQRTRRKPRRPS